MSTRLKSAPPRNSGSVAERQAYFREEDAGGPERKEQPFNKEPIDLSVGGEGREDHTTARMDARNRYACYLWRSDAEYLRNGI